MGKCSCGKARLHEDPKGNSIGETIKGCFHSDRVPCYYPQTDVGTITGNSLATPVILGSSTTGIKHDIDKPDLTDIPKEAIFQMGQAFSFGHEKHGKHTFKASPQPVSEHLSAALRHLFRHLDGENIDTESKATHLGAALARIAMATYTLANHPDQDDRHEQDKQKHLPKE